MGNIKKFEDFLDKMRGLLDNAKKQGHIIVRVEDIENTFPELKESGDEQIRKVLVGWFKRYKEQDTCGSEMFNGIPTDNILTWLEKQGEQKPFDYEDANIQQKDFAPKSAMEAAKEKKIDNANKIEPKFNFSVGQWIVATGKRVYLITKIDGFNVTLVDVDGNEYVFDTSSLEDAHLWTIEDAKDGDVLFHSDSASNGIFIFKEIIDKGFAKEVICYCDYDSEDHFCLGKHHTCCWTDAKILYPATKEQRDTFERAMADAGYIFNFEKKELKKIEESENIKNQIMSEITDFVKDYITQKPVKWSEEDKRIWKDIIRVFKGEISFTSEKANEEYIAWLKSLKQRIGG